MITQNCINEITQAAIIQDVIGEYISLTPKGKSLLGTCPQCNGPQKFSVDKAKEIWKCWVGCASGKGSISFLMWIKTNNNYPEALTILAKKYNITIEEEGKPSEMPTLPKGP